MDDRALKSKIVLNGLQIDDFLNQLKEKGVRMSRSTFYRNLKGDGEFDRDEIQAMKEILKLSDEEMLDIFFRDFVS